MWQRIMKGDRNLIKMTIKKALKRTKRLFVIAVAGICLLTGLAEGSAQAASQSARSDSPAWAVRLGKANKAKQIFVVAGVGDTTAYVSMHEKDKSGKWKEIFGTPGCIGKKGLGKQREGDMKTPVGVYHFTEAFGINKNPGCRGFKYKKVTNKDYWSGDSRKGYKYNKMVNIDSLPGVNTNNCEHIIDYKVSYNYCLNISYNEAGIPGLGSALFLHCLNPQKPYTGGCVAIPEDKMKTVLKNVRKDCVVVIGSLRELSPELWNDWDL